MAGTRCETAAVLDGARRAAAKDRLRRVMEENFDAQQAERTQQTERGAARS
jgi:hypothetical protein